MIVTKGKLNKLVITKLPAAFICGVRITELDNEICAIGVKYKWLTTNPFKSIYFAVLAMAAELSTGGLVLKKSYESSNKYSTLITGMSAQFHKKATGKIIFKCVDGKSIDAYLADAHALQEPQIFTLVSEGFNEDGEKVASFTFEWSVKSRA